MKQPASRDQIRQHNRGLILKVLRRERQLARIELGQATTLSPATVTAITSELIEAGLIVGIESDEPKSSARGRPRSLLAINGTAARVLAIKLTVDQIQLTLADYAGIILASHMIQFESSAANAQNFPPLLKESVIAFLSSLGEPASGIREVAVASQGIVDAPRGSIVWSPAFEGRDIPILPVLEKIFSAKCSIANDANMTTEALHWFNPEKYSGNFAVLMVDHGVGSGLFLNNSLFVGATGAAAELGHVNYIPNGARCRCGRNGCYEAYLADYALTREAKGLPAQINPVSVAIEQDLLSNLLSRAKDGETQVQDLLARAGTALGYCVASLIALINPDRVVLTGSAIRAREFLEPAMHQALNDALVEDLRRGVALDIVDWSDDFVSRGLIARSLRNIDREIARFAEGLIEDGSLQSDEELYT